MRHRLEPSLTDRADVERLVDDDSETNAFNEPTGSSAEYETVATGLKCQFVPESTEFVRSDDGEVVRTPAKAIFGGEPDIEVGDRLSIDGIETRLEVRGVEPQIDHRVGHIYATTVALEAAGAADD